MTRQAERAIQNEIRNALTGDGLFFRANVGRGWTGTPVRRNGLPDGAVLLLDARPFDTGLPSGFSDLFGIRPRLITEADVGNLFGQFAAIECKAAWGRTSTLQAAFLAAISANGGLAGVARSAAEARAIIGGDGDT